MRFVIDTDTLGAEVLRSLVRKADPKAAVHQAGADVDAFLVFPEDVRTAAEECGADADVFTDPECCLIASSLHEALWNVERGWISDRLRGKPPLRINCNSKCEVE